MLFLLILKCTKFSIFLLFNRSSAWNSSSFFKMVLMVESISEYPKFGFNKEKKTNLVRGVKHISNSLFSIEKLDSIIESSSSKYISHSLTWFSMSSKNNEKTN